MERAECEIKMPARISVQKQNVKNFPTHKSKKTKIYTSSPLSSAINMECNLDHESKFLLLNQSLNSFKSVNKQGSSFKQKTKAMYPEQYGKY